MSGAFVVWIVAVALGTGFGLGVAYANRDEPGSAVAAYLFGAFIGMLVGGTLGFIPWLVLAILE
jgi:hypothetical protein